MPHPLDSIPRLKMCMTLIEPFTSKNFQKTQLNQRDAVYYLYIVENFFLLKFKSFPRLNKMYDDF